MMRPHVRTIDVCVDGDNFYPLAEDQMGSNNPSQARHKEDGKPSTVSLTQEHRDGSGEEHEVVWFCEEVNNGFHFYLSWISPY